jgi:hypothetical protein
MCWKVHYFIISWPAVIGYLKLEAFMEQVAYKIIWANFCYIFQYVQSRKPPKNAWYKGQLSAK